MHKAIEILRTHAKPLTENTGDYDALIERIGDNTIVLLGEASHGTHEFYKARAEITKRLITECGFSILAIEGDWPDAHKVDSYIRLNDDIKTSEESLSDFKRFPEWMWRNQEMVGLITWLKEYNNLFYDPRLKVSFNGLDLYSLHRSINVIIEQLAKIDPQAAKNAHERYLCFDSFGTDPQRYGYLASLNPSLSCQSQAIEQLIELQKTDIKSFKYDNLNPHEEKFYLEQNARVVQNAEQYYRSMFFGTPADSWNLRDTHMMQTVESLLDFASVNQKKPKIIVWAHNSHLGDARATQMHQHGELNLGQLIRERYGNKAVSVGFTTYTGTVSASSGWGKDVERKFVRPAIDGSYEALFNELKIPNFLLLMNNPQVHDILSQQLLERAIGVIYLPQSERASHYFYASLAKQFDAVIHFNVTNAVVPLDKTTQWEQGELPETFPFGL